MADKDEPALLHIEGTNLPPGASASCVFGGAASAGAAAPAGAAGSVVGQTAATLSGETTALCRSPVHGALFRSYHPYRCSVVTTPMPLARTRCAPDSRYPLISPLHQPRA